MTQTTLRSCARCREEVNAFLSLKLSGGVCLLLEGHRQGPREMTELEKQEPSRLLQSEKIQFNSENLAWSIDIEDKTYISTNNIYKNNIKRDRSACLF